MFYHLSESITDNLVSAKAIPQKDKSIYQYGVQQGLTVTLNIITTLIVGIAFNMVFESFMFLAVYIPLRKFAGGIHASTAKKCYLYSTIMIIGVLLVIRLFPLDNFICNVCSLISGTIIFFLAPIDSKNKRLDSLERKIYKKRTVAILIIELCIQLILNFFSFPNVIMCFSLALVSLSIVLIIGKIKNTVIEGS